ncbi:MAG TPA: acyl-CoA reductase, partial [Saprospiraceae bacterium]|nr:acyl-CoA reductase [Saprospiraceae bacterium]
PFSRIACLHYEWYDDVNEVMTDIKSRRDDIQCIVSSDRVGDLKVIPPGTTQSPGLFDYADDVDTMHFLSNI